tara:strand:- start:378 stop:554 length:177 start_codon:yes stop_codon:yes gene_type:complete
MREPTIEKKKIKDLELAKKGMNQILMARRNTVILLEGITVFLLGSMNVNPKSLLKQCT